MSSYSAQGIDVPQEKGRTLASIQHLKASQTHVAASGVPQAIGRKVGTPGGCRLGPDLGRECPIHSLLARHSAFARVEAGEVEVACPVGRIQALPPQTQNASQRQPVELRAVRQERLELSEAVAGASCTSRTRLGQGTKEDNRWRRRTVTTGTLRPAC